ncbi:MAG: homocysteine S-methyltransferase family protein [Chloroflexota bacterium]
MKDILGRMKDEIILGAEGYLFELERRGYVKAGPYVPEVVLEFPNAVEELHREFLRAGADVMVAFTYYAHREKMKAIGREGDLEPLNRQALRIARKVAAEGDAYVAGNICNTWAFDPDNAKVSGEVVREIYREQLQWAVEEGVDFIIAETNDYLGEALIALEVIQEFKLPSMITFASVRHDDKTLDEYALDEACKILDDHGADIVGLNCSRGPETFLPLIEKVRNSVKCFVAAQPSPYHTTHDKPTFQALVQDDPRHYLVLDPFVCTRFEMGDFAVKAKDLGVNYIGICCGGAPHHVRQMAEQLGHTAAASRFSSDFSLHPIYGEDVKEQYTDYSKEWIGDADGSAEDDKA